MKKSSAIFLLVLFSLGGCSGCGAIKRLMYEGPGRDDWQKPDEVVASLGLMPGDIVADLGSGGGYFTYPMAEAVGEGGRIYAVDVDESLLAYVASQAEKRGLPQIETVLAPEAGLGLPDAAVNLIFLSNVFHHLPDQVEYFRRARSTLRDQGRIAVVELLGDHFPSGHATPPSEIEAKFEAAGYVLAKRHDFLERQSFQIFVVRPEGDER